MRDLDARDLITGDFLLVHGDLVSNLPIDAALAAHRARRIADKNAIMTMILRAGGLGTHRTKSKGIEPVFVIDPTKNRCLHYEEMHPLQANKYVNLDPELLTMHTEMEIRSDLIDCGIDICTPDVLALWAESFDYEVPRRHFLHGVLKDYELNGKTIHTEIVENHYAARVFNLQSYEAVSKDVLGRWTYPLVPDSNLVADQSYTFQRGGLCKENGVMLARTCKVGKRTVLGKDTSIGDGSIVSNSIIGRGCQIGKNVTIHDSYVWDNVVVSDGTTVERSIVADEAVIGSNCNLEPGSLVSYGVTIGNNQTVKSGSRITRAKRKLQDASDDDPAEHVESDPLLVGEKGIGYGVYDDDDSDDDAAVFHTNLVYSTAHLNLSTDSISTFSSEVSADEPVEGRSHRSSFAGSISDDGEAGTSSDNFHHDAVAGLLDALKDGGNFGPASGARLEFMGLRLSNNASDHQLRRAIAVAFTKRISQLVENDKLGASEAATQAFSVEGVVDFLNDVAVGKEKNEDDQVDFITCLQKDLVHRGIGGVILAAVCQKLYQLDILEEDAFLRWWDEGKGGDEEMKRVREKTVVFVDWLREAEAESSEEEDDEESD